MKKIQMFIAVMLISLGKGSYSQSASPGSKIGFSGIPALGISPDSGFGSGIIGGIYVDEPGYSPYKMAIGLKVFLTTKGVHSHALTLDRTRAFGLPLRLIGRLGFYSTIAQNFCGLASDADCDPSEARRQARLSDGDVEEFVWRYHKHRYMSFFGNIFARWLLRDGNAKLELMTSYRGSYYLNGDFANRGPYEGSLFAHTFLGQKTEGYLSTLELGLMLDGRDSEPAPTSGYWLEGSVRGGAFLIGSSWDYIGGNLAARFYAPFDKKRRLVIASQTIADAIVGDLPFDAMSRIGGSQSQNDATAIGGQIIGRGIAEQLYVGRLKLIEQLELRYTFLSFTALRQDFDLTAAAFGDLAITAWDYHRLARDMRKIHSGFGGGLRISWNKNFVIRADLGASPSESFSPKFYFTVGNIF